ncbi:MAG: endonuclease domain-containing protein [Gammaproteobacteria bacterium]|nr:endonuclease domain-containing protein [Gammaproteobacteria bacterium]
MRTPNSTTRARRLRTQMTDAEQRLWRHLRARQMLGYKFRRQHPIGPFVADFACLQAGLVIEVDGGQHGELETEDARRTRYLNRQGFRVLRFWNHEVLQHTDACLEMILQALGSRVDSSTARSE